MNNSFNYCWVFKRGLPERVCNEIIKNAELKKNQQLNLQVHLVTHLKKRITKVKAEVRRLPMMVINT